MNRRQMLKSLAALGVLPLAAGYDKANASVASLGGVKTKPLTGREAQDMLDARRKARRRTRRIIMNNDGNDARWEAEQPVSPELFLAKRTLGLVGTQVDSVFYCTGVNNIYTQPSQVTEPRRNLGEGYLVEALAKIGTDPLKLMVSFCKQHGKEVFWSMRMNDTHDSGSEFQWISKFKQAHPEVLVGKKGVKMPVASNRWSAFDYGQKPVRDLTVGILTDVVTRYDVDGVELDFFRHPHFFRAQFYGEPVTQADCDKMTGMIRRIRAMCDREGVRRGRPVLIAVRVPDSFGFARAIGLDWEQWLKEELVDVVTGADYLKFEPWANLAAKGRQYHVPVYAGIEQRRLTNGGEPEGGSAAELWRGEAYIAWQAGVNGIYTFNRFNPHDPIFREIGDPSILEKLPRTQTESMTNAKSKGMFRAAYWLKNGDDFLR